MRNAGMAAWMLVMSGAAALAGNAAAPLPELSVPAAQTPPRLDGALDDAVWRAAATLSNLCMIGQPGAGNNPHTVQVIRDDAWLYVGFRVTQPVLDRNPPTFRWHDADLQQEDNVQVSVDPGTDGALYYQFLVSPINTRADFRMARGRGRETWNMPWRSAAAQDDAGWSVELALPLALLLDGGDPARIRFNAMVDTAIVERDASAAQVGVHRETWSWAPLARSFNEPERFGRLRGMDAGAAWKTPFLPLVSAAAVEPYDGRDGNTAYGVRAAVLDAGRQGGSVTLTVEDQPDHGVGQTVRRTVTVPSDGTAETVVIAVPVAALGARTAVVRVVDETGEVRQAVRLDQPEILDIWSVFLDRNYYTTETAARAVYRIGVPAAELRTMTLRAVGSDGRIVAQAGTLPLEGEFYVPLKELPAGAHRVRLELCRAEDVVSRHTLVVTKRAPNPAGEWKVDHIHRILLRNGEPFFPFGVVMFGMTAQDDWAFKDVADMGMNCIYHWRGAAVTHTDDAAAHALAYVHAAGRHGLQVVFRPDAYTIPTAVGADVREVLTPEQRAELSAFVASPRGRSLTRLRTFMVHHARMKGLPVQNKGRIFLSMYERQVPVLRAVADAVKTSSPLLGYNLFDEPNLPGLNQDEAGVAYYALLHDRDGHHPVFVVYNTLWDSPAFMKRITDWCDVLVQNPYWEPAGGRNRPSKAAVTYVATMVARTKRLADSARRVVMTVPQAEYWSGCRKRALTPAEQRCQTYLALIHGSKGIFYFFYPLCSQAMADTIKQLAAEMKTLGPVCLTPDVEQDTMYTPGALDPINQTFMEVHAALRRNPAGGYVLLCANTVDYPVTATFTLSLLGETGAVQHVFSETTLPVSARAFTDRIEGFGTRAYRIRVQPAEGGKQHGHPQSEMEPRTGVRHRSDDPTGRDDGGSKISITVALQPHPELARREPTADADLNRTGKKNKLPNSSFEHAFIPGWPDYYRTAGNPILPDERIGAIHEKWGVDTNRPYHGTQCLRMEVGAPTYIEYQIDPALTPQATDFVFSSWMRANRDGVQAALHVSGVAVSTNVTLTTEWQRYALPVRFPAHTSYLVLRWSDPKTCADGRIWIDAAQLETGKQATEYEP